MVKLSEEDILHHFFPTTQELQLSGRNIEEVENLTFNIDKIKNVKSLDLSKNEIVRVHQEAFYNFRNLEILNLSENQISYLAENLFKNSSELKMLKLADNSIKTLQRKDLELLKKLELLDLTKNQIENLGEKTFKPPSNSVRNFAANITDKIDYSSNLKTIKLTANQITKLYEDNFKGLSNLIELDLSENQVVFDSNTFRYLTNLKRLNLSKNKIMNISDESFKELSKLEELNLSENEIEFLGTSKSNYPNESSDPANFTNKQLTGKPFSGLKNLRTLNLSLNKINKIDSECFLDLENLEKFLISNNDLKHFDFACFLKNSKIQHVDLSQNQICKINFSSKNAIGAFMGALMGSSSYLTNLRILKLYKNKIQSLDGLSSLPKLEVLILDYYDVLNRHNMFSTHFEVHFFI